MYLELEKNHAHLQATFSVSSKNFKKAVERNRIKRLMREAYRLQKNPLQDGLEEDQLHLAVFIIYNGNQLPEFDIVFEKTGEILFRLLQIISK